MAHSTPPHRDPRLLAVVAAGGMVGALSRWGVGHLAGPVDTPWPTLVVNLAGAFVLGWLLESLALSGPDEKARRLVRLGLGTGFCGAFTTWSSLAVETLQLAESGRRPAAVGHLGANLVGGLVLALVGLLLARALHPVREGR